MLEAPAEDLAPFKGEQPVPGEPVTVTIVAVVLAVRVVPAGEDSVALALTTRNSICDQRVHVLIGDSERPEHGIRGVGGIRACRLEWSNSKQHHSRRGCQK
jgi:hypothetical protein